MKKYSFHEAMEYYIRNEQLDVLKATYEHSTLPQWAKDIITQREQWTQEGKCDTCGRTLDRLPYDELHNIHLVSCAVCIHERTSTSFPSLV